MFFENRIFFSQEGATFSTFWELLLIQLHLTTLIFIFSGFFKKVNFSKKTPIFYLKKKQILNNLRTFIHSVALFSKFATLSSFSLEKVFVRNETIFFLKAPKLWTFWRFLLVQLHCSASLPHLAVFKKNPQIFRKTHFFKQKT